MLNKESTRPRSDRLIFVDPDDPSLPFWWPAMIVPESEYQIFKETMDYDISAIKPNEQLVCYFEDGSFSIIPKSASVIFHPEKEPFISYVHNIRGFLNDEAIDRALKYREIGEIPDNFTWLRLLEFGYTTTLNSIPKMKRRIRKRDQTTMMEDDTLINNDAFSSLKIIPFPSSIIINSSIGGSGNGSGSNNNSPKDTTNNNSSNNKNSNIGSNNNSNNSNNVNGSNSNQEVKVKKKGRKKINIMINTKSPSGNTQHYTSSTSISSSIKKENNSTKLDSRLFNKYQYIGHLLPLTPLKQLREKILLMHEMNKQEIK